MLTIHFRTAGVALLLLILPAPAIAIDEEADVFKDHSDILFELCMNDSPGTNPQVEENKECNEIVDGIIEKVSIGVIPISLFESGVKRYKSKTSCRDSADGQIQGDDVPIECFDFLW